MGRTSRKREAMADDGGLRSAAGQAFMPDRHFEDAFVGTLFSGAVLALLLLAGVADGSDSHVLHTGPVSAVDEDWKQE